MHYSHSVEVAHKQAMKEANEKVREKFGTENYNKDCMTNYWFKCYELAFSRLKAVID